MSENGTRRRNILLITTDQMRYDSLLPKFRMPETDVFFEGTEASSTSTMTTRTSGITCGTIRSTPRSGRT